MRSTFRSAALSRQFSIHWLSRARYLTSQTTERDE